MDDVLTVRKRLGLTQVALADRLGVRQATISRFESGVQPLDKRTALALKALIFEDEAAGFDHAGSDTAAETMPSPGIVSARSPSERGVAA